MALVSRIVLGDFGTITNHPVHVIMGDTDVATPLSESDMGFVATPTAAQKSLPVLPLNDAVKYKVLARLYVRGRTSTGRSKTQEILVKNDPTVIAGVVNALVKDTPVTYRGIIVGSVGTSKGRRVSAT